MLQDIAELSALRDGGGPEKPIVVFFFLDGLAFLRLYSLSESVEKSKPP